MFYRIHHSNPLRRRFGHAAPGASQEIQRTGALVGQALPPVRRIVQTVASSVGVFVTMAGAAAGSRGCAGWVEKTPANLYAVDVIERWVPGARFVHIVREGADVVASLCAVAHGWGHPRPVSDQLPPIDVHMGG